MSTPGHRPGEPTDRGDDRSWPRQANVSARNLRAEAPVPADDDPEPVEFPDVLLGDGRKEPASVDPGFDLFLRHHFRRYSPTTMTTGRHHCEARAGRAWRKTLDVYASGPVLAASRHVSQCARHHKRLCMTSTDA